MDEREDTFPMDITDPSSRPWKQSSSLGRCRHLLPALVEGGFCDGSSSEGCHVARRQLLFGFRAGARMRALIGIDGSSTSEAALVGLDALCGREGATC